MKRKLYALPVLLLFALVLGLSHTPTAFAANQVVGNCSNDTELRSDLQALQLNGGGTLTFNCGTTTIFLTGVLPEINATTTIDGGGTITLNANDASRILHVHTGAGLTLKNIVLSHARFTGSAILSEGSLTVSNSHFLNNQATSANGGAITADGPLTISNSEFAYNTAPNGGALYITYTGTSLITGSNFHDNETYDPTYSYGGALYARDGGTVTIESSLFNANQARSGGGIFIDAGTRLNLRLSTVEYNQVSITGGGIYNYGGTLTLIDDTLTGNNGAGFGGGIYNIGSTLVYKSTFSSNYATDGGGLFNNNSATLENVTMTANTATNGGGLYNNSGATLRNVTLYHNLATDGGNVYNNQSSLAVKNTLLAHGVQGANCSGFTGGLFNLSDDNSCGFGAGRDNVNLGLGLLANNGGATLTHLPGAGSPAIDGGTSSGAPATDQRGISRPQGAGFDVGAVEVVQCGSKPAKPALQSPANGKKTKGPAIAINWNDATCAQLFTVQVRLGSAQGTKVYVHKNLTASQDTTTNLTKGKTYYWQVTAINSYGKTKSDWWAFKVK